MMRLPSTAGALLILAGCASFSPDGGFDSVGQLAQERAGVTPSWQRTETKAKPLKRAPRNCSGSP